MKAILVLFAVGAFLAGCAPSENRPSNSTESGYRLNTKPVPIPEWDNPSKIALAGEIRQVHVGDAVNDAERAFDKPDKRRSDFRDLPPGFGPGYSSRGWETDTGGYGLISAEGRVVAAVRSEYGVSEDRLQEILRKYRADLTVEQPTESGGNARYWFAEDNNRRLMVCAVGLPDGSLDVTQAIGSIDAMDAMRMGPIPARNDISLLRSKRTSGGIKD